MATKTFIPAFEANVGDWKYYICIMKYAQVAREVQFAHELGGNKDLNTLIQRGISARTDGIRDYLLKSKHRFLGSLIVATWGGDPKYQELKMDDPDGILKGVDKGFGVLTLDGSHQFFALDGQHRLRAIKDAIKQQPSLGAEDICVLLVSHYDTAAGRERTQRLFTNINRNAKTTTQAENIALDVDDAFAITTRALLTDHPFFSEKGRVRVFVRPPSEGDFTLAAGSVPVSDPSAFTTITVLYDLLKLLGWDLPPEIADLQNRPSDKVLKETYDVLAHRLEQLMKATDDIRSKLQASTNAKDLRAPKGKEGNGHPMMRPVVQKALARAIQTVVDQELLTYDQVLERIAKLTWKISNAPWTAVFNTENNKMITAKENTELLEELIRAHIAPTSKAEIARARKNFKAIRLSNYPASQEQLEKSIIEVAD
ncbi:DNA sulfur modification protein DndB [Mycobacterium sp. 3519A]|uniref:DNA sulfur modification protein DndB n=1 Tax=Mycobacterium sp. 3519A TaxID=2057184 RepID=UPI000C7DF4D0|nr:DNA sulfur modification protein DndB [Mycobacterium sp. 3519A]